ncbi:MAG: class I SAM-dependent methyltransferase [Pseudomonadota bacterium]
MANSAQKAYWTSPSGNEWAEMAERIDAAHANVTRELVRRSRVLPNQLVLDVGCGAGTSVRAFLGAGARVTGLDLSPRLLAHAQASLPEGAFATFLEADAQDHPFDPETYDRIVSQFGVMFFEEPVAAFANLRKATKTGGRLCFAAWASAEENPWFHIPKAAADAELGMIEVDPNAPSPTAFRDIGRVENLLRAAGWEDVQGTVVDLDITPPGRLAEAADQATRLGLASRIIRATGAGEDKRMRIVARIVDDLASYETADGMQVPGRFNFFEAVSS